jgi:hypothetical protein
MDQNCLRFPQVPLVKEVLLTSVQTPCFLFYAEIRATEYSRYTSLLGAVELHTSLSSHHSASLLDKLCLIYSARILVWNTITLNNKTDGLPLTYIFDFTPFRVIHFSLISSLALAFIHYDGMRVCLRTALTNGPILHRSGDMQPSRAMMMMPAGDNS